MKRIFILFSALLMSLMSFAIETPVDSAINLSEVTVSSLYRNNVNVGYLLNSKILLSKNHGQEPSHIFGTMPNIFSLNDNGTDFGYGYFRIRGLDQTRINVTLDGMPWNEAEDYGTYFANSPDLMSSLNSIKVERGTSSTNNGTASSGGSINLESINLLGDNESYAYIGAGSFNTYKTSVIYNSGLFGKSALHIKATQQQTDGFKDYGFNNSQAFTLKYGYYFNENNNIEILSLNGRHRNGQGWVGNTMAELNANKHANGNTKAEDDEWFQSVNKIQYKAKFTDNVFFTASTYLQYQKGWYNFDLDNYMTRLVDPTLVNTDIVYTYGLKHYLYGANAATKFYLDNFTLTLGTNIYAYQREHYLDNRLNKHFKNVDPSEFYDNTGYKLDINGFVASTYTLNKFNFGANIQYRYVNFRYRDHLDNRNNFDWGPFGTNWNFINYGINAEYHINNASKIYARYSEVSREPTRTDMFGGNEFFPGDLTTNKAERSKDIEFGYEISNSKVKANLNGYYMYFHNERVLNGQLGLNGLPLHDTADKSYRLGIEGTIDWNFYDNFHYSLNTSLSKNKITSATYNDKTHIMTPAFTFNNEIYYDGGNWKAGINNIYHTKMYIDQNNTYSIPEYLTFNINGSYRYKNVEIGAVVNNIFNKTNYINATEGATELLWFRNAGTNFMGELKFYF